MLFVIDLQNDFIDQNQGKMAINGADALIEPIKKKIREYREKGDLVVFTKDSHIEVYQGSKESQSSEEKKYDEEEIAWGHEIVKALQEEFKSSESFEKKYHGISPDDLHEFKKQYGDQKECLKTIEFVGTETHVCILSNAVLIQNLFPDSEILIDENFVMSSDNGLHQQSLTIMENLNMKVRRKKS